MKRRTFMKWTAGSVLASAGITATANVNLQDLSVQLALVQHGSNWKARPRALIRLAAEIRKRCNIPLRHRYSEPTLNQIANCATPILFLSGNSSFKPPSSEAARELRWILDSGGFLFFDDQDGRSDSPFYKSAVAFMAKVYPETPEPRILPADHTIYQSYYLLKEPRGRLSRADFLEGWPRGKFTPAIFSHNDLLGALEADQSGNWRYNLEIGGGFRRELCFRLAINLVYYSLTLNYKKDRAFPPVLKRRRRQ